MIRPLPQLRSAIQRTLPPLLVALSVAVILLGRADQGVLDSLRTDVGDVAAPLLGLLSRPVGAVSAITDRLHAVVAMYQENLQLERDNERLLHWQQDALRLAAQNRQLRALLKLVPDRALSYVTARVIANSGGAYVRSVMINGGSEDGLARGQAAITGEGLVGRLTQVGRQASRVLLITDFNSRIPVTIAGAHVSAILAGDNSERPRLLYLPSAAAVKVGDRVVTAGVGGVFPPGLPVGAVVSIGPDQPRVEPYVALSQIGYLRIVNYGLAGALPKLPVAVRRARASRRLEGSGAPDVQ